MELKGHRKNFNNRFNIISVDSQAEAFQKFKQRILNIFETVECSYTQTDPAGSSDEWIETGIDKVVTKNGIFKFCQHYGISQSKATERIIIDRLNNETNKEKLYELVEVILLLECKTSHTKHYTVFGLKEFEETMNQEQKSFLVEEIKEAFHQSDIDVTVAQTKSGIVLYPKGEKYFDEELVNKTISFLDKESNKDFEKSLKFCKSRNLKESANNLQSSLENYLRYKLGNTKGIGTS